MLEQDGEGGSRVSEGKTRAPGHGDTPWTTCRDRSGTLALRLRQPVGCMCPKPSSELQQKWTFASHSALEIMSPWADLGTRSPFSLRLVQPRQPLPTLHLGQPTLLSRGQGSSRREQPAGPGTSFLGRLGPQDTRRLQQPPTLLTDCIKQRGVSRGRSKGRLP